jgi:hypothetical protein
MQSSPVSVISDDRIVGQLIKSAGGVAIPANATTTILTLPLWPAVNSVGRLRVELESVVAVGASPHFGLQVWDFTCRRLAGGIVSRAVNLIDDTSSSSALEHDVVVADSSGDLIVRVTSSATSAAAVANVVAFYRRGVPFALA